MQIYSELHLLYTPLQEKKQNAKRIYPVYTPAKAIKNPTRPFLFQLFRSDVYALRHDLIFPSL